MPDFIYLGGADNVQVNGQQAAKQVEQTEQYLEEMVEVVRNTPRPPIKKIEDKIVWVDEIEHDHSKRCQRCKGRCGYISVAGVWECHGFVPMTNGDYIRRMSDEQLASYLTEVAEQKYHVSISYESRLEWLKEETPLY